MADFCSCGAQLPPDARFCHKCGKPLFEIEPEVIAVAEPVAPEAVPVLPVLRNPLAVRIALLAAFFSVLATMATGVILAFVPLPAIEIVALGWYFVSGYGASVTYSRRTGMRLSIADGARLGWLTSLIAFAFVTVLFAMNAAAGGLEPLVSEFSKRAGSDPMKQEMIQTLHTTSGMFTFLIMVLLLFFALVSAMGAAGGALGAKTSTDR